MKKKEITEEESQENQESEGTENLSERAVKNSGNSLTCAILYKIGGFVFAILMARMLLPELFGIYAFALSIITIFMTFTELGINETLLRYLSEAIGKNNFSKARTYIRYLFKIKFIAVFIVIIALLLSSKYLAYNFYDKPLLFYPLIFSCLFIVAESFKNLFGNILVASNQMKPLPFLELLHQITKITFSVIAVLLLSTEFKVAGLFVAFALAGFIQLFFFILIPYMKNKSLFVGKKISIDKQRIRKFLGFMSLASLSLVFFTSMDMLMLGKFVDAAYMAYYRVALSFVFTIASLLSFSGILLPIFTQIDGERLERGFKKTIKYIMLVAIPSTVGLFFIAKPLILVVYGSEYVLATSSLYLLSILILTMPLITFYTTICESRESSKVVAKSVFVSLLVNILLNYVLIKSLLNVSQEYAILGACLATVVSRLVLLGFLIANTKSKFNLSMKGAGIGKLIVGALVMAGFLLVFSLVVDITIYSGLIGLIIGGIIYLGVLMFTKSIGKEDFNLLKGLIKRK